MKLYAKYDVEQGRTSVVCTPEGCKFCTVDDALKIRYAKPAHTTSGAFLNCSVRFLTKLQGDARSQFVRTLNFVDYQGLTFSVTRDGSEEGSISLMSASEFNAMVSHYDRDTTRWARA